MTALAVVLSGCTRGKPPAEVVYRSKLPDITGGAMTPIEVRETAQASRPNLMLPKTQVTIGLIVPLTGPQAEIGGQLRDAALMGLYDTIQESPKLDAAATPKLLMRDSGGNAEQTARMTQELIDGGAQLIIGPLVAANVQAAGNVARNNSVPLIAFSNNIKVAQPGVFVYGFVPHQQVKRIADFAADSQIKHYAAIGQQDDYGRMVIRDFSRTLATKKLTVQPVEFFNAGEMPASPVISRIASDAGDVGRERKAVFLPITGKPLSSISLRLMQDIKANNGFLKLLGTGLWDNPQTLQDPGLKGAWFATTSPENAYNYNDRFFSQYGYAPSRISSLAYDAVSMAALNGIGQGPSALTVKALTRKQGYDNPANGRVKFNTSGIVERALAIVEVGNQGFRIIDAPKYSER
ncbi:MAG: penicillin-binding protein activator [Rickettsiales bacterium]|nr:penicillin-binding protein activator [Rickettsiales bacterium]